MKDLLSVMDEERSEPGSTRELQGFNKHTKVQTSRSLNGGVPQPLEGPHLLTCSRFTAIEGHLASLVCRHYCNALGMVPLFAHSYIDRINSNEE